MEILDFIINGAETKRYHTVPTLTEQRIDAHSFHVAMLVWVMTPGHKLTVPALMAALAHDLAEHKMGDLPAPVKRALPGYDTPTGYQSFRKVWGDQETELLDEVGMDYETRLDKEELRILKLADAMQGALFCTRERMMGNKLIETTYFNFRNYIADLLLPKEENKNVTAVVQYIDDMWEQARG